MPFPADALQPGDILVFRGHREISRLIRWMDDADASHVGVFLGPYTWRSGREVLWSSTYAGDDRPDVVLLTLEAAVAPFSRVYVQRHKGMPADEGERDLALKSLARSARRYYRRAGQLGSGPPQTRFSMQDLLVVGMLLAQEQSVPDWIDWAKLKPLMDGLVTWAQQESDRQMFCSELVARCFNSTDRDMAHGALRIELPRRPLPPRPAFQPMWFPTEIEDILDVVVQFGFSEAVERVTKRGPDILLEAVGMALCQEVVEQLVDRTSSASGADRDEEFQRFRTRLLLMYATNGGEDFVTPGDFLRTDSLCCAGIYDRAGWVEGEPLELSGRQVVEREIRDGRRSIVGASPKP
jgi:hypothetical protein